MTPKIRSPYVAIIAAVLMLTGCGTPKPATSVPETPLQTAARVSDQVANDLHQLNNVKRDLASQKMITPAVEHQIDLAILNAAPKVKQFNATARTISTIDATNKIQLYDLIKQVATIIADIAGLTNDATYQAVFNLINTGVQTLIALTQ